MAIAVTLFVGLTSNADWLSQRVEMLYEGSNMASLWVNVLNEEEGDKAAIENIVATEGAVETRYSIQGKVNGKTATALLMDELPSINKPYRTDNQSNEDFFIIDERILEYSFDEDNTWLNSDGTYKEIPVEISFAMFRDILNQTSLNDLLPLVLNEKTLNQIEPFLTPDVKEFLASKSTMSLLDMCVKKGKKNIFDSAYLEADFLVTGTMMSAENVQSASMNDSSFILDTSYFQRVLVSLAKDNFAIPPISTSTSEEDLIFIFLLRALEDYSALNFVDTIATYVASAFSLNQYIIKLNDETLLTSINSQIEDYFNSKEDNNLLLIQTKDTLMSNVTIENDIVQARQLAYVFPIIFFVVAILVVLTTLSQLILKDRTNIGTLKAIGVSKTQIILHYIILGISIVFIGTAIGIILGPFVIPFIMNQKYAILYSLPELGFVIALPETIIITIIILALTALVTFLIVYKEVSLKPSDSMRPASPKSFKQSLTKAKKNEKPLNLSFKMAFRNIALNIPRSIMVIIGVLGCTALLVCGFGIDDTLNNCIQHDLTSFYDSDTIVTYSSTTSKKEQIYNIGGVELVEEYSSIPITILLDDRSSSTVATIVQDNSSFFKIDDNYQIKDKIVITRKVANELDIQVGDTIRFLAVGKEYQGEVGFINTAFYMNGIYLNASYSNYNELFNYLTFAWVNVEDENNVININEQIKTISGVSNVATRQETIDKINSYAESISLMTLAVKVFAILLAVIVLYNLALLNFKERLRNIATLKVLGFTRLEIGVSLGVEIMCLTTFGIGFGMLLGNPLMRFVLYVNQTPLVDYLYATYPQTYLIAFAITFLTALLVTIYLTIKTRSVKMVESLKSIE